MNTTKTEGPIMFDRERRGVPRLEELARPLPSTVLDRLDGDVVARHAELGRRYGNARGAVITVRQRVAAAHLADEQAAAEAARGLRALPKPSEPKAQQALAEAERAERAAGTALAESADELLALALPELEAAAADASRAVDELRDRAGELTQAAIDALATAGQTVREATWISTTRSSGRRRVAPFAGGGGPASAAAGTLGVALAQLAEEETRRSELAEWRQKMAEAELPPPPAPGEAEISASSSGEPAA